MVYHDDVYHPKHARDYRSVGSALEDIAALTSQFNILDLIDILLVTLVFYAVLRLFAGTQGVQLLRGVLVLVLLGVLASSFTGFSAFSWLIRSSGIVVLVAIPVVFQPELRRALERLGRTGFMFGRASRSTGTAKLISELLDACQRMSQVRSGAIIVLEGQTGLQDTIETGVRMGGQVTSELLQTIFYPGTPLHDGAVIIREERLEAAACVLPLTSRPLPDPTLGNRHRAALGITEESDALAIIVSEETGIMSAARNGRLVRRLDDKRLRRVLEQFFESKGQVVQIEEEHPAP